MCKKREIEREREAKKERQNEESDIKKERDVCICIQKNAHTVLLFNILTS